MLEFSSFLLYNGIKTEGIGMNFVLGFIIFAIILVCILGTVASLSQLKRDNKSTTFQNPYLNGLTLDDYTLGDEIPTINYYGVILDDNEVVHYACPVKTYIEKEKVVGYSGRSLGVNVRIAKGLYYRTGNNKGVPVRRNIKDYIQGDVIVNSNRVIFNGAKNSFDVPFKKISSFSHDGNIVFFQINSKVIPFEMDFEQMTIMLFLLHLLTAPIIDPDRDLDVEKVYDFILSCNEVSVSKIQRKFKASYSAASNALNELEDKEYIKYDADDGWIIMKNHS